MHILSILQDNFFWNKTWIFFFLHNKFHLLQMFKKNFIINLWKLHYFFLMIMKHLNHQFLTKIIIHSNNLFITLAILHFIIDLFIVLTNFKNLVILTLCNNYQPTNVHVFINYFLNFLLRFTLQVSSLSQLNSF